MNAMKLLPPPPKGRSATYPIHRDDYLSPSEKIKWPYTMEFLLNGLPDGISMVIDGKECKLMRTEDVEKEMKKTIRKEVIELSKTKKSGKGKKGC